MYYTSSNGRIELQMTLVEAKSCTHPGQCDADVKALSLKPNIYRQLAKLNPEDVADELRAYGAWSAYELRDHKENLQRILWIAAGDIVERKS